MVFPHCLCNLVWTGIDIYTSARQILIDCAITSSLRFICSSQVANMVISMNVKGIFVFRLNSWCFIKLNQLEFFALQNLAFHTVVLEDLKANCQDIKKILSSCFFFKSKALILWRWLLCRISLRLIGLWKYPGDHTIKRLEFFFLYLLELNIQDYENGGF